MEFRGHFYERSIGKNVVNLATSYSYQFLYPLFERNRKVKVLERNSGFTEGLGRRLPSPDGSDQDISPYFAEGGNNPVLEAGEEPVDFYRLERTGKDFCL